MIFSNTADYFLKFCEDILDSVIVKNNTNHPSKLQEQHWVWSKKTLNSYKSRLSLKGACENLSAEEPGWKAVQ